MKASHQSVEKVQRKLGFKLLRQEKCFPVSLPQIFFAVHYWGKETVVSGLEQLEAHISSMYDGEDYDQAEVKMVVDEVEAANQSAKNCGPVDKVPQNSRPMV